MIKKLYIKNFQSHKETTLDLGPGINSIVGDNDSGKTAIFRDINWLRTNRPLRNSFIRKGQDENALTEIEIDSCTITREKGKKTNEYRLSGVEEPFTSFGQNPPEDIVEALNLDEINVQSQLDLPFLVLSSPGEIARHIREISKLDIIDEVVSLVKSDISSTTSLLDTKKKELEGRERKLKDLEKIDIELLQKYILEAETRTEENKEIMSFISSLSNVISELEEVKRDQLILPSNLDEILKEVEDRTISLEKVEKDISDLGKIVNELEEVKKDTVILPSDINSIFAEIELAISEYNNTEEEISNLENIISELESVEDKVKGLEEKIKEEQRNLFELLDKIEVCPLCERGNMSDKEKDRILENYR